MNVFFYKLILICASYCVWFCLEIPQLFRLSIHADWTFDQTFSNMITSAAASLVALWLWTTRRECSLQTASLKQAHIKATYYSLKQSFIYQVSDLNHIGILRRLMDSDQATRAFREKITTSSVSAVRKWGYISIVNIQTLVQSILNPL